MRRLVHKIYRRMPQHGFEFRSPDRPEVRDRAIADMIRRMWELESDAERRRYTKLAETNAKLTNKLRFAGLADGAGDQPSPPEHEQFQGEFDDQPAAFPESAETGGGGGPGGWQPAAVAGGATGRGHAGLSYAERRERNRAARV